jgi:hypothetical protein
MAQISSISNGEAMSTVRTKLNNVITEINLLDPTDWVDYSATSTVVGWSVLTTKVLKYRVIGKQVFFLIHLEGTSNSPSTTFTMPFTAVNYCDNVCYGVNNGVAGACLFQAPSSSTVTCYFNYGGWTSSGTKVALGQFFINIA